MRNHKPLAPETTRRARLIEVIETVSIRGDGVETPVREVIQYWDKNGNLLAENDNAIHATVNTNERI